MFKVLAGSGFLKVEKPLEVNIFPQAVMNKQQNNGNRADRDQHQTGPGKADGAKKIPVNGRLDTHREESDAKKDESGDVQSPAVYPWSDNKENPKNEK
jgi:hypothetical protein